MNLSTETWIYIGIGYVALCVLAYFIQERFIFKPEKLHADFEYKYDDPFEELHFEPEAGVKINGLRFYHEKPEGLVMYFHGNTRSIKGWSKYAVDFTRHGYDVVMIPAFVGVFSNNSEDNLLVKTSFPTLLSYQHFFFG